MSRLPYQQQQQPQWTSNLRTSHVGMEEEGHGDPRVRALVDALRLNPPTPPAPALQETRRPAEPARQSSHIELATVLDDIRTNPQRWSNPGPPLSREARRSEQHRSSSVTKPRAVPPPLQASPGKSDSAAAAATTVAGSAASTARGWEKQDQPLPTMGDDGGRGGGVANARNVPVGAADDSDADNIVTWDGPDDPANPANWPMIKKYQTSLILSLFSFIAPFSATMVGPAMTVIGTELNIAPGTEQQLIQGMQVLAAGIGPFFIAPIIELFGRANVIRYAHLWHLIWNTACGFATSGPQLLAFRFIGGLGASAPQILAPGLTADVYPAPMGGRGDAVHAYLPFFGSAIAPIFGAFVTQESDWRWIFWGTSIISVVAVALAFLFLDETYHPLLLERKAARLRKETGNQRLHTPFHDPNQSNSDRILKRAAVPWFMLVSHPIVQLPFGYRAYLFGIMYFVISTYGQNFMNVYGMDMENASVNFLSLGVGFVVGLHISRYAIDGFSAYFRRRHRTTGHSPEWRLPVNGGAALFLPPALILYGWGLRNQLHYIIINISAFFLAIGLILGYFSLQPYVTESYGLEYASSAHSVGAFLQHIAEFAFPIFGPSVTSSDLGFGWSYTLLAALTLAICTMMPLILWHFGPAIRRISTKGLPVEPSGRR
ncbi:MFS general substrate transporter [Colletotrichum caudatum]|nr:MFS general substrate transporter [Colletotrichum caudatum]